MEWMRLVLDFGRGQFCGLLGEPGLLLVLLP